MAAFTSCSSHTALRVPAGRQPAFMCAEKKSYGSRPLHCWQSPTLSPDQLRTRWYRGRCRSGQSGRCQTTAPGECSGQHTTKALGCGSPAPSGCVRVSVLAG
eukprot:COSAG01_NODE_6093_length_3854_cov_7.192011_6_plen_101_part_01